MNSKENIACEYDEINFEDIFHDAPTCMVIASKNGKILKANKAFSQVLGYTNEQLENTELTEITYKNKNIQLDKKATSFEVGLVHSEGQIINFLTKIKLLQKGNSLLVFEEGTPAEKEKEEITFLNALMENFPFSFYFKNIKGEFFKVSQTMMNDLDISDPDVLNGKTDFDLFSEELAQKSYEDEQEIIKSGKPKLNMEEKETWPDGKETWVSTTKLPLKNKNGEIIGTFGISQDITERKQFEIDVKEKTSILNAITNKMPVVIYKYTPQKGVTSLFGDEEIIDAFYNSKVARLNVADSLSKFTVRIQNNKEKQGYYNFPSTFHSTDEERYFNNYLFEARSDKQEFIGLALDVSDRKIAEQHLKRNAKNLEKINKELNQFAYIVSHDLKAPLRAITNLSEWIEEDLGEIEDENVKENLRLLRSRVHRMESLINGILAYSRVTRSSVEYEETNTEQLVKEIIESLGIQENIEVNIKGKLPSIYFQKVSLEQIFTNLISNAVKHRNEPKGNIDISYKFKGGCHEFTVADDGPGIEEKYHEKIFQIFQTLQARDTLESTGVGLAIVKKIIEDRGGSIRVESKKDHGSKFIFTLPKKKPE